MKYIISALFIVFISDASLATSVMSLSGKITDKKTGEALPGATILVPEYKTGAVSDAGGNYKIDHLPAVRTLIQVSLAGYRTIVETVDLSAGGLKNFELEYAITELNEVVVTSLSKASEQKRTPTPISVLHQQDLLQAASTNIIDAIAGQPGIAQITTGAGISKPVIRGLGYNRVIVVNDGIRQEGQQWGDEHGIEIDEYAVNKVEILKGPASLAYGSDAMAGVINMLSTTPAQDGQILGKASANYQTNNGLFGYSADLAGNRNGLVWEARYSRKLAHAYRNKYDGYVFNSGLRENALSGFAGLNKSWGYAHLSLSAYQLRPGIVEGERDSASGQFVKPVLLPDGTGGSVIASDTDLKSYTPTTPYQKIHHYKAVLNNSFILGQGNLKVTLGFQQNQRQEYADVLTPGQYGLYFLLNTVSYSALYNLPETGKWHFSAGANGMQQSSGNKGAEFLVPEYGLFDIGFFGMAKRNFGKVDLSGGLRYDTRAVDGRALYLDADGNPVEPSTPGAVPKFDAFRSTFSGLSGSIGVTWQISNTVFAKLNIARGYRAPNIAELASNGIHEGTIRYEIGDPGLKAENSLQFDVALGLNTDHITAELNLFDNSVDHFIFLHKLNSTAGGDSLLDGYNAFRFAAGNAHLYGGEFRVDIHPHPLDWLHFENAFSYVRAIQKNQPDSTRFLPFTPAPKWQSTLKADFRKAGRFLRNAYVRLDADAYFAQNDVYSAFETETRTPGYTLLNAGLGADIAQAGRTLCSLYLSVNNLTDRAYQNHLSRLKYGAPNNASGRSGVYNMGRNFSLKAVVPLNLR